MSLSKYAIKTLEEKYIPACHILYYIVGEEYSVGTRNKTMCINLGDITVQGRYLGKLSIISTYGGSNTNCIHLAQCFKIRKQRFTGNNTNHRFVHPNVYFDGMICLGNIRESIHHLLMNRELLEAVRLTKEFLTTSYEHGFIPYRNIKCMKCNKYWSDCRCRSH